MVVHGLWDAVAVSRGHDVDLAHLSSEAAGEVADTMQALAASSRVRILSRLTAGPCSVKELARAVDMEQPGRPAAALAARPRPGRRQTRGSQDDLQAVRQARRRAAGRSRRTHRTPTRRRRKLDQGHVSGEPVERGVKLSSMQRRRSRPPA